MLAVRAIKGRAYVINLLNKMRDKVSQVLAPFTLLFVLIGGSAPSFSQTQVSPSEFPASAYECTQVGINDIDETLMTREEKIARMDISLIDSIDSYTSCVNTVQNEMSGGGGAGTASADALAGLANGEQQASEQAGAGEQSQIRIQGTGAPQSGSVAQNTNSQTTTNAQRGVIAPKDNDSIICKLLFNEIQKASAASLPGLEKQYRDYQCAK